MKCNLFFLLLLFIAGCQGNRNNQNDNTSASVEIDTCTEINRCIEISKFLEDDVFLKISQDATFYEDFEFDDNFCLHTVLKEITKQEYHQNKIKEKDIFSSDTIYLDSICLVLGNYDEKDYHLIRYEKQINSYLVFYDFLLEGYIPVRCHLLIDKKTAKATNLGREPAISPNGKMLVTSTNYGDPEIYTTLLFYKINEKGLTMKKGFWERDIQIGEIYWVSDKEILIQAFTNDDAEKYFSMIFE